MRSLVCWVCSCVCLPSVWSQLCSFLMLTSQRLVKRYDNVFRYSLCFRLRQMFSSSPNVFVFVGGCFCVFTCQSHNSWTVWDIVVKFLWEQDVIKSSDDVENGCVPIHWCSTIVSRFNLKVTSPKHTVCLHLSVTTRAVILCQAGASGAGIISTADVPVINSFIMPPYQYSIW